jgi:hypothetical protein
MPTGACCTPTTGGCQETTQADCTANWQGAGTSCMPNICPLAKGDMNCDHAVDATDMPLFVEALLDPTALDIAHPSCLSTQANMDGNGLVNGLDIQPFVNLLIGN